MKHKFMKIASTCLLMVALILSTVTMAFADSAKGWTIETPMNFPREAFQSTIINGKIYVFGGTIDGTSSGSGCINSVEAYDPSSKKWTAKAPMPIKRAYFQMEVLNGMVYIFGGYNGSYLTSLEKYDPATDSWSELAPLHVARDCFQSEIIDGKIYAIGGAGADSKGLEVYDPESNTWTTKADMHFNRVRFQTQVIDGKIYAIGGLGDGENTLEVYDPKTDIWTVLASMKMNRIGLQSEVVDGKIYALGGGDNSIEEYDPALDKWLIKATMSVAREYFQTRVIDGKIYILCGSDRTSTEIFDPQSNKVIPLPATSIEREFLTTELLDNKLYVIGGSYSNKVESYLLDAQPTLTVTASPNKVKVGQQFTTDIAIHNETNICAEDIKLTYDKDLFEYEGATGQTGTKIYKEDASTPGTIRFITACQGKDTAATEDKGLITLKFKAKAKGVGKVDIVKGRIADNATLEEDVADENCGEDTITVDGYQDVNRSGNFTLLDLGIDAYYDGMNASDTDSTKYDADVIPDGKIDDNDLVQITQEILANKDYAPNN